MSAKLQDQVSYPPRAMRAERAAAYLDISRSLFLELVEEGKLPKPRQWPEHEAPRWDRLELESAWDDLNDDRRRNTFDQVVLGFERNAREPKKD
jgi:predicted DNA-binding transcriptional regulator AlpA